MPRKSAVWLAAVCLAAGCVPKVTFEPDVLATSHGSVPVELPAGTSAKKKSGELHFLNGRVWYALFIDATDDVMKTDGIEIPTEDLGEGASRGIKHVSSYDMQGSIMQFESKGAASVKGGKVAVEALEVDGRRYDLSKGRVFLCRFEDGQMNVKQLPLDCARHTIQKAIRQKSTPQTDREDRERETDRAREIGRTLIARHAEIRNFLKR